MALVPVVVVVARASWTFPYLVCLPCVALNALSYALVLYF